MPTLDRRDLLALAAAAVPASFLSSHVRAAGTNRDIRSRMAFGLVTYQWGNDWDLPTLIMNCEVARVFGVELRTNPRPRRRADARPKAAPRSSATLCGEPPGASRTWQRRAIRINPNPTVLKSAVAKVKEFVRLSHDVGGTGVKVKPDRFHPGVPPEQTIEQIGKSLNEVADYGAGYGQQVRLEVHGKCAELSTIKAIMDIADHENAVVCWNSNPQDLADEGLESNFNLVCNRFGRTCHVHPLDDPQYPYQQLLQLLIASEYDGWVMLESGDRPADRQAALARQAVLFAEMVVQAEKHLSA